MQSVHPDGGRKHAPEEVQDRRHSLRHLGQRVQHRPHLQQATACNHTLTTMTVWRSKPVNLRNMAGMRRQRRPLISCRAGPPHTQAQIP